jgi:hypothetical protein
VKEGRPETGGGDCKGNATHSQEKGEVTMVKMPKELAFRQDANQSILKNGRCANDQDRRHGGCTRNGGSQGRKACKANIRSCKSWRFCAFGEAKEGLMPRIYTRKEDAKREKVTVPVSANFLCRLKEYAVTVNMSHAEAARRFIEVGLERETTNEGHRRIDQAGVTRSLVVGATHGDHRNGRDFAGVFDLELNMTLAPEETEPKTNNRSRSTTCSMK